MDTQIRPCQKYTETAIRYKVEQSTGVFFQDKKEVNTSFIFSIYQYKRKEKSMIWVVDRTYNSAYPTGNTYLDLIHDLEYYSYPFVVEVDEYGSLLNMVNYAGWLHKWRKTTQKLTSISDNASDLRNQYLEVAENESKFFGNKTKEPFWNLLFFSPSGYKGEVESESTIQWYIKTVGNILCKGKVKYDVLEKELKINFIAENSITEELSNIINEKYQRTFSHYKAQLSITMEYHFQKYHYTKKTADFRLYDKDFLLYEEKVSIELK